MPEQPSNEHPQVHTDVGYEKTDTTIRPMLTLGIIIILFGLVAHVVCLWMFDGFKASAERHDPKRPPVAEKRLNFTIKEDRDRIPEPRLQVDEELDLDIVRARDEARLTGSGWADKEKGTVFIPIKEAMKLMANPEIAKAHGIRVEQAADKNAPPGGKK